MARWSSTRVLLELTVLLHTHLQILFFFFSIFKFFVSDRSEILWTDLSSLQVMRQGYKSLEKQIKTGIICSAPENPLRSGWHKLSVSVRVCEDLCSSFFFFLITQRTLLGEKNLHCNVTATHLRLQISNNNRNGYLILQPVVYSLV